VRVTRSGLERERGWGNNATRQPESASEGSTKLTVKGDSCEKDAEGEKKWGCGDLQLRTMKKKDDLVSGRRVVCVRKGTKKGGGKKKRITSRRRKNDGGARKPLVQRVSQRSKKCRKKERIKPTRIISAL